MYAKTQPATKPALPVKDLRKVLGIHHTDDDSLLKDYIAEATSMVERLYSISVMDQEWTITADGWFDERHYRRLAYGYGFISLEKVPFGSITRIGYDTADQADVEWTEYRLVSNGYHRAKLQPMYTDQWPLLPNMAGTVRIVYRTGVASADLVEPGVRQTIRDIAQYNYDHDCPPSDDWVKALSYQMAWNAAGAYA